MGRRTTFSRNNSFLPRLSFKSWGKRETWRFGWRSRVKWCPWFVSKRILFLPFSSCFLASRTGCATALFQYGEVKRILSISFSLIERNDNSTCVNSIQNKKNKKKGNKREEDRVDFTSEIVRSLRWGKKKHFPRYCSRLFSLLVETSLLWNDTFESNRSWGTNVAKLVGWKRSRTMEIEVGELVTFLPTNAKFDQSNKYRIAWLRFINSLTSRFFLPSIIITFEILLRNR